MSDTGLHLITINRALRIVIAGKNGQDPVAGMVTQVFNITGIDFEYEPEYSGLNDVKADIAVLTPFLSDYNSNLIDFDDNLKLLRLISANISEGGTLIYYNDDEALREIASGSRADLKKIPYKMHGYFQNKSGVFAATHNRTLPVTFAGDENMKSLSAAREVCLAVGVSEDDFYMAMMSFRGTIF